MPTVTPRSGRSRHRGLLMILGAGGLTAAVAVAAPGLGLPSTSNSSITNSPKEVIDQVWQIVYRGLTAAVAVAAPGLGLPSTSNSCLLYTSDAADEV